MESIGPILGGLIQLLFMVVLEMTQPLEPLLKIKQPIVLPLLLQKLLLVTKLRLFVLVLSGCCKLLVLTVMRQ